jgi:hypothetical protein
MNINRDIGNVLQGVKMLTVELRGVLDEGWIDEETINILELW